MTTLRGGYVYRGKPGLVAMNAAILAARPPDREFGGRPDGAPGHGTKAGFSRHRKAREKPCEACRAAARAAQRRYETNSRQRKTAREQQEGVS